MLSALRYSNQMSLEPYLLSEKGHDLAIKIFSQLEEHMIDNGITLSIFKDRYAKLKRRFVG